MCPPRKATIAIFATIAAMMMCCAAYGASARDKLANDVRAYDYDQYTIDVVNKPFGEIAKEIQQIAGINILPGQFADVPVSITMPQGQDWRDALVIILAQIKADIDVVNPTTIKVISMPKIAFVNTKISTAIYTLAKSSGKNVIIDHDIEDRNITIHLEGVDFEDALRAIAEAGGYELVKQSDNLYRIASAATLRLQLVTTKIELKYLRPDPQYKPYISAQVAIHPDSSKSFDPLDEDQLPEKRFPVLLALRQMLTRDPEDSEQTIGNIEYISTTNTLIITDVKTKIDQITEIVKEIDRAPYQVMIDVKFVTTSNTDFFDFGVDFANGLTAFANGSSTFISFPFTTASNVLGSAFGAVSSSARAGATGIGSGSDYGLWLDPDQDGSADRMPFTFGSLGFDQLQATLRLLKDDQATEIIQRPQIMTMDHKEATIFVGQKVRYAKTSAATNSQGGLSFSIEEDSNSPVDTGFQLLVIPHVVKGGVDKNGKMVPDRVMMTVIPESETLVGTTSPISGFDRFEGTETSTGSTVVLDLPQVASSTLVTTMMLKSNQTAVIGGLITERDSERVRKVPFLGDIPVLGYLFKNKYHNIVKSNLIIFVTPRIIYSDTDIEDILDRETKLNKRNYPNKYPEAADGEERKRDIEDVYNKLMGRSDKYNEWRRYDDPYGIGKLRDKPAEAESETEDAPDVKDDVDEGAETRPADAAQPEAKEESQED